MFVPPWSASNTIQRPSGLNFGAISRPGIVVSWRGSPWPSIGAIQMSYVPARADL